MQYAIPETLAAMTISSVVLSVMERVSAMLIHVAFSILVFCAIRTPKKRWMFPLAILLHTFLDIFTALYQVGFITNIVIFEVLLFLAVLAFFCITLRFVYRKMPE
jgi:uncharacterized membrane protein YhfC